MSLPENYSEREETNGDGYKTATAVQRRKNLFHPRAPACGSGQDIAPGSDSRGYQP